MLKKEQIEMKRELISTYPFLINNNESFPLRSGKHAGLQNRSEIV